MLDFCLQTRSFVLQSLIQLNKYLALERPRKEKMKRCDERIIIPFAVSFLLIHKFDLLIERGGGDGK